MILNSLDLLQLVKLANVFRGEIFLSIKPTNSLARKDLMSDPESVAKWLQIRNNSLRLLSLGENPGIEKYEFCELKSKHSIILFCRANIKVVHD